MGFVFFIFLLLLLLQSCSWFTDLSDKLEVNLTLLCRDIEECMCFYCQLVISFTIIKLVSTSPIPQVALLALFPPIFLPLKDWLLSYGTNNFMLWCFMMVLHTNATFNSYFVVGLGLQAHIVTCKSQLLSLLNKKKENKDRWLWDILSNIHQANCWIT